MKPADRDRHAARAKLAPNIQRTRKLVGLNADQRDEPAPRFPYAPRNPGDVDDGIALVKYLGLDIDVGTQRAFAGALRDEAVDAREAVGRNRGAAPLDDVAVVVIVRRLDQHDQKLSLIHISEPTRRTPI